ncbi:acriflavine sensitivity control acr-2 [Fusarium heterosporum]|uniref:Acriflavine sensitivity control acr-2 n=1 Tax=Fusarium heterosporum TaxID=42747 RepID=A0A8H5WL19_FUSHE|nr:acriflavine sensitivity control acr-2 [Fusarium heterosporum]
MTLSKQYEAARDAHTHLVMVIVVIVFSIITSISAVSLRLWCRRSIKVFYWDDAAAVMAMICVISLGSGFLRLIPLGLDSQTGTIPTEKIVSFYKCTYIVSFFYSQGLFWAKMTFLLLYYRILSLSNWRRTYVVAIAVLVLWDICQILVFFLQCTPLRGIWDRRSKARCVHNRLEMAYALAGINIFTDLAVATLPLPFIWSLNLRLSQKVTLSAIFGLGSFSIALAIVRIKWVETWSTSTWDIIRPNLWALAEVTSALVCACIPTYKPLLVKAKNRVRHQKSTTSGFVPERQGSDSEVALRGASFGSQASSIKKPESACHPELQVTVGLVRQGAGKLFPYHPEFFDNASGLYGPGATYCWYMLLASVFFNWIFCRADRDGFKRPGLSSDLLGALVYPVFAATDLLVQSVRMQGMGQRALVILCLRFPETDIKIFGPFDDSEIDLSHIPPDVLDLGQHVVDITGPLTICYTAATFLVLLVILFCSGLNLFEIGDWRPMSLASSIKSRACGHCINAQARDQMASANTDKTKKRPKVRGCYQCSRRRIDCDRKEPACGKCSSKGIKCSGLGLRYRFNDGIAARGKFVGKTLPINDGEESKLPREAGSVESRTVKGRKHDPFRPSGYEIAKKPTVEVDKTVEEMPETQHLMVAKHVPISIDWGLDHVDPKSRFCLGYFSNNIAQLIAVINMGFNGYRDLVLPRAETDPLVRKAVLLVVEQHLSLQNGTAISLDPVAYGSLVRELILRSHQCAPQDDDSALTALLLLHIREMISGSDNFKLIYGSLRVVVNALAENSDNKRSDLRKFLQMQILRVCLFGESLFNETNGVHFIQAQKQACLEFILWCDRFHPELQHLLSQLATLTTWACDIYVHRAMLNPPAEETVHIIERFKQSLEEVDAYVDIVGRHLLAWPYFIVAAESSTKDHREFFLDKLVSLHNQTGCWNLLRAIDQVKEIWASQSSIRWTSLLGGPTQAFIM